MNKICAIVVTYNRKILLKQSLQALLDQTVTDFDILVVDNASTDNTGNTLMTSYKKSELITSTRELTSVGQGALTTV